MDTRVRTNRDLARVYLDQAIGKPAAPRVDRTASSVYRVDCVRQVGTHDGYIADRIGPEKRHDVFGFIGIIAFVANHPVDLLVVWNGYGVGRGDAVVYGNVILLRFVLRNVICDYIASTSGDCEQCAEQQQATTNSQAFHGVLSQTFPAELRKLLGIVVVEGAKVKYLDVKPRETSLSHWLRT